MLTKFEAEHWSALFVLKIVKTAIFCIFPPLEVLCHELGLKIFEFMLIV